MSSLGTVEAGSTARTTPAITWATPAPIAFGTALSSAQLNAATSVPGSFAYTPAAGTVPAAGTDALGVTFTPADTTKYNSATASVSLVVEQPAAARSTPTITWSTPAAIAYGTALSSKQLDATASVAGTFAYSPAAGTVLSVGTHSLTVTFTPSNTSSYSTSTKSVSLVVNSAATTKTTPSITWSTPAEIYWGVALSSKQLDATASVAGTFAYSPAAGTVLSAGTHTLKVTFTPSNTSAYNSSTKTVSLTVGKSTPRITWATPVAINYGTALSSTQLNATASVAGTFAYSPGAGTVLSMGTHTLTASFTPSNSTDLNSLTTSVSLVVKSATPTKTTPTITWPTPAAISYGAALSSSQLDATASVAGTFAYSPAAGTILSVGTHTLTTTFSPSNSTAYNSATKSVSIVVNSASTSKTTPTITWPTPAPITYGTALSSKQLDASASVPGTFVYSPAAGTLPAVGTDTLTANFTPTDTTHYNNESASVSLVVNSSSTSPGGTALSACADLTTSGSYYLSQDVSSSETCFFIDADNITLNLNGHTITYDTGGAAGAPGILLADNWYNGSGYPLQRTGSTKRHGGFVVYGGTLNESANGGIQSRGIWIGQADDLSPAPVIHDMVINTYTQDAAPIFGTVSLSGMQIYNNTVNWACKSTYPATGTVCDSSRYELYGYAIWIADEPNGAGVVPDNIYNNKIIAAPQGGIYDTHQNAQIHNNDITFSAYFSNDYCIANVSGNNQVISENNCHPTSGRGIDVETANTQVLNNTISVIELPQNAEYGGCELAGADGIRVRDNAYQGNPASPTDDLISGNTIAASATKCQANGLRITQLLANDKVTFVNNKVTTTSPNSNASYTLQDYAISFDGDIQPPLTFTTNTLQSQHAWVEVDWDGASASIDSGQNWVGTPKYSVDDENGYRDSADGGPTFTQYLTIDGSIGSTVHCGTYAAGVVQTGSTSLTCN